MWEVDCAADLKASSFDAGRADAESTYRILLVTTF